MNRLPTPFGTRIDRSRPLTFRFEGKAVAGFAGDTIASALAGQGQMMLSRSFKYHRPRGGFALAGGDAATLVQVGAEPNVPADLFPAEAGLEVRAQNVFGSLERDGAAVLDRLSRFLPVGFYYRTFMGPGRSAWFRLWEPWIRAVAGLGRLDTGQTPEPGDRGFLSAGVVVVGSGPAGLAAAAEAVAAGADTLLIEAAPELGGTLEWAPGSDKGHEDGAEGGLLAAVRGLPDLRVMTGATVSGLFADRWLSVVQGRTLWRIRADAVILATGGYEQPAVFSGNDRPGILSAGAVRRLIRLWGVAPGRRVAVLAGTPEGIDAAEDLRAAGLELAALILPRPLPAHEARIAALEAPVITASVEVAEGRTRLRRLRAGGRWIEADCLAVAAGRAPAWHLPCQAGASVVQDPVTQRFMLTTPHAGVHLAGTLAGAVGHSAVIASGRAAARAALGLAPGCQTPEDEDATLAYWPQPLTRAARGKDFVDLDEDLTIADLENAVAEGYREPELLKRFTTLGMGPSQGRHSALAAAAVLARATGRALAGPVVTTARPPAAPESLGALAGAGHVAERRTALHARHLSLGARMAPAGAWWRPLQYGTEPDAIHAEVGLVRNGAGLLDVSTLGKLEVRGADAGALLDRLYTMRHASQPVGRVRYGLMLNDLGAVIDDGVVFRMAEDCFYVTATTGAAARVWSEMARRIAEWRLSVDVANLTGAFGAINLTGPLARRVLEALPSDIDWSPAGFPYLAGRIGQVAGVPVRALRIGFTGEVSYELHAPASLMPALWDAVMDAGAPHGLKAYGLEASRILRLEKGHILIGQDTDALSDPDELGLGWALATAKPDFVGRRSVLLRRGLAPVRRLVGLGFAAGTTGLGESCLVLDAGQPAGHLTSVGLSPTLGHPVALAFVPSAAAQPGMPVTVKARDGRLLTAMVTALPFFDPGNSRQEL